MRGKINYHLTLKIYSLCFIFDLRSQLLKTLRNEMWQYYIALLVLIVLWFLFCVIFSEQVQKSIFTDIFTSKLISMWNESMFLIPKYHQLQVFSELRSETQKLVCFHRNSRRHSNVFIALISFIVQTESARNRRW